MLPQWPRSVYSRLVLYQEKAPASAVLDYIMDVKWLVSPNIPEALIYRVRQFSHADVAIASDDDVYALLPVSHAPK